MNLLITNTQEEKPPLILRGLRHEAKRIAVTVSEGNLFKRQSDISAWIRQGIITVTPEYSALTRILDKSLILKAADRSATQ